MVPVKTNVLPLNGPSPGASVACGCTPACSSRPTSSPPWPAKYFRTSPAMFAPPLPPTHRALGRHAPPLLGLHHAHDLGDNIAGAMYDDPRAHVDALLVDLGFVVHRHVANGHPADDHWCYVRDRGEHARAADVAGDLLDSRLRLLGRVLERDRPTRRARHEPELELLIETVDLDHHA